MKKMIITMLILSTLLLSGCIVERFACVYLEDDIVFENTPEGDIKVSKGLYKAHVALFANKERCDALQGVNSTNSTGG